jgi:DNA-binding XRE family transcriptional regulator
MTRASPSPAPVRRPGIGIAIDRHKLKALRESALLERIDLARLSELTELRQLADRYRIDHSKITDRYELAALLGGNAIALPRHPGVSRDAIAKIENGDRQRPKIHTLRLIIDTLNTEFARRGKPLIGVEDLYPDGHRSPIGETAANEDTARAEYTDNGRALTGTAESIEDTAPGQPE